MSATITLPVWLFTLILLFAAVTLASHFLFPSVRWYLRRRAERVVARLNQRLERPIQPFKLARRSDMIQRLCYDPEVTRAIVEHAREYGVREDVAFEQARRYAREIVPSFSATAYYGVAIRLARIFSNALYRVRLGYQDEAALAAVDRDATVVFVMNHRSNMDYVLVTYLAANRSALSYAVGEWARVWPLSFLIKAMGAYFIRRKSRNALYRRVLARYVQMATQGGVAQALFPEGGLSLDGAIAPPRMGLLKYILEGADLSQRDVVFVPVALNYDRVLEDRILLAAGAAGTRRFRARISVVAGFAIRTFWRRLTGRFDGFGYAAVNFGPPVSLRAHPGLAADADALAAEVMQRIAAVVPALPVPVVAYVLGHHGPLTRLQIRQHVAQRMDGPDLPPLHLPGDDHSSAVESGISALLSRRIILERDGICSIAPDQRPALDFYANSVRHLF
ncbi:1-acyl-sn-glycerol-3-phosphate acyltransferase [Puniceibacterium confluentis]|uniref:1-acyl-sn-glycerol-3-phosphate acyltransferase n=1 Tax=Puniceibacterium confluentis TaxID=1958944 RepID=UPI003565F07D